MDPSEVTRVYGLTDAEQQGQEMGVSHQNEKPEEPSFVADAYADGRESPYESISSSLQTQVPEPVVAEHSYANFALMRRRDDEDAPVDPGVALVNPSITPLGQLPRLRRGCAKVLTIERGVDRTGGAEAIESPERSSVCSLDGSPDSQPKKRNPLTIDCNIDRKKEWKAQLEKLSEERANEFPATGNTFDKSPDIMEWRTLNEDEEDCISFPSLDCNTNPSISESESDKEQKEMRDGRHSEKVGAYNIPFTKSRDDMKWKPLGKDEEECISFPGMDVKSLDETEELSSGWIVSDSVTGDTRQRLADRTMVVEDESRMPGAHYVGSDIGLSLDTADNMQRPPAPVPDDTDMFVPVEARLVNTEDEENRIQDLEAQNRMLREREQNVVMAQVLDKSEIIKSLFNLRDPEFRRQRICILAFIVLALVAIVLGIVLTRDDGTSGPSPTPAPTPEPTTEGQKTLSEFLAASASFDDGAALYNQETPQYKAAKWLANNNSNVDDYTDKEKIQRYVLATLYFSTNGNKWTNRTNWLDDGAECGRWSQAGQEKTLSCTGDGDVDTIFLESSNLVGSFPPELALLSSLEMVDMSGNKVTGTLPTELAFLSSLRSFNVDNNALNGTIPTELGLMKQLSFLGMLGNDLTGTIPSQILFLTNLLTLRLGGSVKGTIPSTIGNLNRLTDLRLHENELTGALPSEIGQLTQLVDLYLWTNQLSSTIPSTIGLMTSLQFLYLDGNSLVGTIPNQVQNLNRVVDFLLSGNVMSGTIPTIFGLMTSVEELHLDDNAFTGSIPTELGLMSSNMDELVLGDNSLTGSIPTELLLLKSMTVLFLQGNALTGMIPEDIGTLTNLVHLSLHKNQLTGTVPSSILNLPNLETLWIENNNFVGPFTCPPAIVECSVSCEDAANASCRVL